MKLIVGQTLIEKPLYSGHFYSGHFFWAPGEYFGQNLPLNRGQLMAGWENRKYMNVFVWHISLLKHEAHYLIFPSSFHACCNTCISIKKQFVGISGPNPTSRLILFPVTSTPTRWFVNWRNLESTLLQFSGTCPTNCQGSQSIQRRVRNSNRWRWE